MTDLKIINAHVHFEYIPLIKETKEFFQELNINSLCSFLLFICRSGKGRKIAREFP